jgi:hypothetical protein
VSFPPIRLGFAHVMYNPPKLVSHLRGDAKGYCLEAARQRYLDEGLGRDATRTDERCMSHGHPLGEEALARIGVAADLALRGLGGAQ